MSFQTVVNGATSHSLPLGGGLGWGAAPFAFAPAFDDLHPTLTLPSRGGKDAAASANVCAEA